ncbi:MAG: DUF3570 domain-containing protein [Chlorobiaceae bacterium]
MISVSKTASATLGVALCTAAMTLPSVNFASAETAPDRTLVSMKYLNYQDSQSGDTALTSGMSRDRIAVNALSFSVVAPVAGQWSIGASFIEDSVTGASPAYHSSGFPAPQPKGVSGASGELRHAGDLSLTRYFSQGSLTGGISYSQESDYISRALSLQGSLSTEDKNSTFTLGGSFDDDAIKLSAPNVVASKKQGADEKKQVAAVLAGVTRVLTKNDIAQFNVGYSRGQGYYTDPYKEPDVRPRDRNNTTLLGRWNHHIETSDGTLQLSYRYYSDTFGIRAHTFGAEYVQPLKHGWTVTPLLRLYSQSEADFYVATSAAEQATPSTPTPPPSTARYYSEDQRLSAFGAVTLGVKVSKQLGSEWLADIKLEEYEQRDEWSLCRKGDPGVATFRFRSIQIGLSRQF